MALIQLTQTTRASSKKDLELARNSFQNLLKRKEIGFYQVVEREELWSLCERRGQEIKTHFSSVVVLGIGGSSLGGRALQMALCPLSQQDLIFVDNVDGYEWETFCQSWKSPENIHWVLISKSGSTLETLTLADAASTFLKKHGLNLEERSTVISEEKRSPLTDWARKNNIPILPIPEDIGGRFSVLTPVGMLPAVFLGLSLEGFRRGARWSLQQEELISELVAQTLQSWRRQEGLTVFWSYCSYLKFWGEWTRQLWAESLAKKKNNYGQPGSFVSVPYPCLGSTDQHSVLQQIMEGFEKKFIWFLRVEESEVKGGSTQGIFTEQTRMADRPLGFLLKVFAEATQESLYKEGIESLTLSIKKLDEESLGALFMILMLTVGALGEAIEINAFDQPGVELGKRLATQRLKEN